MFIDTILDNKQENVENDLLKFLPLLNPNLSPNGLKFADSFDRIYHYSDELKFFHYSGLLSNIKNISDGIIERSLSMSGYSMKNNELALIKFIGEGMERFSQMVYRKKGLVFSPYSDISSKAINIFNITSTSKRQRKKPKFVRFSFDEKSKFRWTDGFDLKTGKKILLPAQSVYLSYNFEKEKIIYIPTSTGTAGSISFTKALSRAICELIERDHFLITYLTKISPPEIRLSSIKNEEINEIIQKIQKYRFELHILDLTLDFNIPTFLVVVINRAGFGAGVSLGLKTDINPYEAIKGALLETFHPRCWIRRIVDEQPELLEKVDPQKIVTIRDRALYWYPKNQIKKLEFLLKGKEKNIDNSNKQIEKTSNKNQLLSLVSKLWNNNLDIYYKDITFPTFKKLGYNVIKVMIPQTVPFYLDERYSYLGGNRLYSVPKTMGYKNKDIKEEELNTIPHPFL